MSVPAACCIYAVPYIHKRRPAFYLYKSLCGNVRRPMRVRNTKEQSSHSSFNR